MAEQISVQVIVANLLLLYTTARTQTENQGNASVIFRSSHSRCKSKLTRNPVLMYNQEQPEKWVSIIQVVGLFLFFVCKKNQANISSHYFAEKKKKRSAGANVIISCAMHDHVGWGMPLRGPRLLPQQVRESVVQYDAWDVVVDSN